jgi:hypothetical protein
MEYTSDAAHRLRALAYPLLGVPERFLLDGVDDIFHIINHSASQWQPAEYLAAVREGLASSDDLAKLMMLDEHCSDATVREFLRRAEVSIAKRFDLSRTAASR